jgi:hypothetical protein
LSSPLTASDFAVGLLSCSRLRSARQQPTRARGTATDASDSWRPLDRCSGGWSRFAALNVASGFVIGKCYKRHRPTEFLDFLKQVDTSVPDGLDVHIVMDNYATHKRKTIKARPTA